VIKWTVETMQAYHCMKYTLNYIHHPSAKITPHAEKVFALSV
jgi:hypothetical protein